MDTTQLNYKYICKHDDNVHHNPNHPNLDEIGSPQTKNCHKAYRERRSKRQVPTNAVHREQDPCSKKIRKLSNIETSEFIIKNGIKDELLCSQLQMSRVWRVRTTLPILSFAVHQKSQ